MKLNIIEEIAYGLGDLDLTFESIGAQAGSDIDVLVIGKDIAKAAEKLEKKFNATRISDEAGISKKRYIMALGKNTIDIRLKKD